MMKEIYETFEEMMKEWKSEEMMKKKIGEEMI